MSFLRQVRRAMPEAQRNACVDALRERLRERPEVLVACLHGSFHEGRSFRDVDVAVWLDPASGIDPEWEYAVDLATSLSRALRLAVDVQILNSAPLAFRYHALRGEPLLVRDDAYLAELRANTWDRYFDFQPFARTYWREAVSG